MDKDVVAECITNEDCQNLGKKGVCQRNGTCSTPRKLYERCAGEGTPCDEDFPKSTGKKRKQNRFCHNEQCLVQCDDDGSSNVKSIGDGKFVTVFSGVCVNSEQCGISQYCESGDCKPRVDLGGACTVIGSADQCVEGGICDGRKCFPACTFTIPCRNNEDGKLSCRYINSESLYGKCVEMDSSPVEKVVIPMSSWAVGFIVLGVIVFLIWALNAVIVFLFFKRKLYLKKLSREAEEDHPFE